MPPDASGHHRELLALLRRMVFVGGTGDGLPNQLL